MVATLRVRLPAGTASSGSPRHLRTTYEIAELLGISPSTVQNHVERGLAHLRRELEV